MNLKSLIKRALPLFGLSYRHVAVPVFRSNIYSQNGEDGVIEFLLKKMPTLPRYLIDIGANDGVESSNSRWLIEKYGFDGLLIEPYPPAFENLKNLYQNQVGMTLSNQAVGATSHQGAINWHGHFQSLPTPIRQVNEVLEQAPQEIGFLSIDVDGQDNEVLQSIDWKRHRPWFVIAEIDSSAPNHLQAQTDIMDQAGYQPFLHIGNVFYVRKDKAGELLFNWKTPFSGVFGVFKKTL
ncbi:FkbM family methyltransferase [Candidatus Uhrbacteria bacterium]|nr:FkbM family methyltransferase [Candidatus Uhrbacteria bacterium]